MSAMRVNKAWMVAAVGLLAGCGTATPLQPPPDVAGVLTLAAATPPDPGGEVGGASTEFDAATDLSMWKKLSATEKDVDRIAKLDVDKTAKGAMYLEPKTSAWFDGFRGPFVYQDLAGDIVMHAGSRSRARRAAVPRGSSPRRPDGQGAQTFAAPHWMAITTGTTDKAGQLEMTYTTEGQFSRPKESRSSPSWVDLVLARLGSVAVALYKEDGGTWKIGNRWPSRTFPRCCSGGSAAYTDWDSYSTLKKNAAQGNAKQVKGTPDLKMTVDFVRFLRPELPDYADPLNTASVPDDVLIKLVTPSGA